MEIIFGTTNKRKVTDLQNVINGLGLNFQVLSLDDIRWDRGEIEENGKTIEENSLIKSEAIRSFCQEKDIELPIITDDAGLFVEILGDEPGVTTARYADDEIAADPSLPDYQCVYKLLRKLQNEKNRRAIYKCCVTCSLPNQKPFQELGASNGSIALAPSGAMTKPYFYSLFILEGTNVVFSELKPEELGETYRYQALKKALIKLNKLLEEKEVYTKKLNNSKGTNQ